MSIALVSAAPAATRTDIQRIVSPKGIEFWFVRDTSFPMLSMEFCFIGGSSQDPADKPGVANLVAALLDEGAGDLDARAFHERVEAGAIGLSFGAGRDTLRGSLKTLNDNRDEAFGLLRLALTAPRFDPQELDRVRAALLANLRQRSTNPSDIAQDRWYEHAFAGHPYGRPVPGTLESVPGITPDDLRQYTQRVVARSNLKVVIVGAVESETAAKLVDRVFGDLPARGELAAVPDVSPLGLGAREVVDLDVPQTVMMFGGPGLQRSDPDFIPAFVLNHILGGGGSFESRLFKEVREKRGLAYSVYTGLGTLKHAGLFTGAVSTRNERAMETIDIITGEIRRIANEGPTADELEKAKRYLIGSYPLRFDTSAKIASNLLDIQFDDLGIDYVDKRNAEVQKVSIADVRRAAGRFLSNMQLLVLMVGRPVIAAKGAGQ